MFPTHTLVNNNWLFPLSFLPNKQIVLLVKRYSKQCFSRKLTTDSRAIRTVWCSSLWSLEILTLKTSLPVKAVIHNAPYCSIRLIMVLLWFCHFDYEYFTKFQVKEFLLQTILKAKFISAKEPRLIYWSVVWNYICLVMKSSIMGIIKQLYLVYFNKICNLFYCPVLIACRIII